ncbi:MarR family winged helix-turn-helix transcriptional regulator [Micromonospora sp. NPDC048935]|uniref:MarR family winged helix-turn-helix transcriptional regulator n=1 Tax=Micromonospora sp. NPDC048935 TaxID=3364262 RepID=UPI003711F136
MARNSLVVNWLSLVRLCNDLTQTIERELAREHQMCASAYELMAVLAFVRGWTRLVDLTAQVSRSQSQVSRLVAQMEAAGAVERTAAPEDGRGSQVRLTDSGRELFAKATVTIDGLLRDADLPATVRLFADGPR